MVQIYLLKVLYQSQHKPEITQIMQIKKQYFKIFTPSTDCISKINNIQIDNAKDIDVVIPMYNLIEYSDNYSKTSRRLWQHFRDESALTDADAIANFYAANNRNFLKLTQKITGKTATNSRKDFIKIFK